MFGNRISVRCKSMKATLASGSFGGTKHICRSSSSDKLHQSENPADLAMNKENMPDIEEKERLAKMKESGLPLEKALKEKNNNVHRLRRHTSTDSRQALSMEVRTEIIREMLKIEDHHVENVVKDLCGNIKDVVWCPAYVHPSLKGRARGGDELSHHQCKLCQQVCFHLLNDGEKYRPCLRCAGWDEKDIPSWYYHPKCHFCKE